MAIGRSASSKTVVAVGFDPEVFKRLNELSEHEARSFASMIRILVNEGIAARKYASATTSPRGNLDDRLTTFLSEDRHHD